MRFLAAAPLHCVLFEYRGSQAGRDRAGGDMDWRAGAAELCVAGQPSADAQLCWQAGGHLFVEGMEAAGERQ